LAKVCGKQIYRCFKENKTPSIDRVKRQGWQIQTMITLYQPTKKKNLVLKVTGSIVNYAINCHLTICVVVS